MLWNTRDLGYLTMLGRHTPWSRARSAPARRTFAAGRLGALEVRGDNVLLGVPFTFTKANVDGFDF